MSRRKNLHPPQAKITLETTTLSSHAAPPTQLSRPASSPYDSSLYDSPPWSVTTKAIVAVVTLVLTALVIWRFQALLAPFVIALILAYLLHPLIGLVEKRIHLTRGIAVLLVYIVLAILILGGATVLGFVVADQVQRLSNELPGLFERAPALLQSLLTYLQAKPLTLGPYTLDFMKVVRELDWGSMVQEVTNLIKTIFSSGGSLASQLAQATLDVLTLSFLIFVVSIYLARDSPRLGDAIRNVAQQPGYRQDAERLITDFVQIWNSYLRGQVILCLIMGIVVSIVLGILGVNNALALGLLWGALEFLPIIGPIIGAIAAVLVAFFQESNRLGMMPFHFALLILGIMTVLQQLEHNLLVPRVVGEALDLHPLIVLFGVLMGASLAGVLGAVLAAPVLASLKLLGVYAWHKMLDLPPFPEPSALAAHKATTKSAGWWMRVQGWTTGLRAESKRR